MISKMMYWKLAIYKGITGPFMTAVVGTPAVIMAWETMTQTAKIIAVIAFMTTWYKAFDLFLDQTMGRLAKGLPPIQLPGGNGHDADVIIESKSVITTTTPKEVIVDSKTVTPTNP